MLYGPCIYCKYPIRDWQEFSIVVINKREFPVHVWCKIDKNAKKLTINEFKTRIKHSCLKCAGSKLCPKHKRLEKYIGMPITEIPKKLLNNHNSIKSHA